MTQQAQDLPSTGTATYAFGVCRAVETSVLAGLSGLTGALVRPLPFGDLVAVVEDVPAEEFDRRTWGERLADLSALERCARTHHRVVTAVAACGPVVPLALGTLFLGDDSARAALAADSVRFHAALGRIEGRAEWGVKVYAAPVAARPSPVATPAREVAHRPGAAHEAEAVHGPWPDEPTGHGPAAAEGRGRAYLDRVRGRHRAREEGQAAALRAVDEVDAELRAVAVASRRLRAHGPRLAGAPDPQLLNATYLVDDSRAAEFADLVRRLARRSSPSPDPAPDPAPDPGSGPAPGSDPRCGLRIELSGPWVPYSFAGKV